MKSSVEQLNDTRVKVTVEVPFEELQPEIDQAFAALAQQVQIPGFRRGKAPRKLIEARIGRGPILEQVVNDMLPSRYSKAVEENDIKVIGQPTIDITKIEDGKLVEFTAEVDVRPEFDVPDFAKLDVEVPALEKADDAAIDKELDSLRARFGTLKDVDRKVKKGDFVTLDLSATVDGEQVEEATTEGLSHEVGNGELIEGLDEAVEGLSKDESTTFTTKLVAGEHKDKDAEVTVKVGSVKERELPEADDEFAQMASEFDTVEELRESLGKQVEDTAKNNQAASIRDAVLNKALEQTEFPLPESVVEAQFEGQMQQLMGQFGGDESVFNSILEAQGTSREDFDKETRESAEKAVRTQLFLDAVAEIEDPEVSQQEVTEHIMFTAQQYGVEPAQFVAQLQQSGQIANLFADVRRGKALAAAICKVEVKDTDGNAVNVKEFFGEDEAEGEDEKPAEKAEKSDEKKSDKKDDSKKTKKADEKKSGEKKAKKAESKKSEKKDAKKDDAEKSEK